MTLIFVVVRLQHLQIMVATTMVMGRKVPVLNLHLVQQRQKEYQQALLKTTNR